MNTERTHRMNVSITGYIDLQKLVFIIGPAEKLPEPNKAKFHPHFTK